MTIQDVNSKTIQFTKAVSISIVTTTTTHENSKPEIEICYILIKMQTDTPRPLQTIKLTESELILLQKVLQEIL